jgi:hypothetical protein
MFVAVGLDAAALASPWIDSGDTRTRHHIQVLVDSGVIRIPATTWPLAWVSVNQGLDDVEVNSLTAQQSWSVHYLRHAFNKASERFYTESRSRLSSHQAVFEGFDANSREAREAQTAIFYTGNSVAVNLSGTFVDDPFDGKESRADGSYLAVLLGNWATGIGAIDGWWGPGWQSSLILSTNARPAPGLFIKRNRTDAFETPLLNWLGEWQFASFAGELQDSNYLADKPVIWGARFNFAPAPGLEFGVARTAVWADNNFLNLATELSDFELDGLANRGLSKQAEVSALDIRYGRSLGMASLAIYSQFISERSRGEVAGNKGAGNEMALAGIELATFGWDIQNRLAFELSNTIASFDSTAQYNRAYEYQTYPTGYRHRGRPIGAESDNDSEVFSLLGQHHFTNGHYLDWRIVRADINRDGINNADPAGSVFGDQRSKVTNCQLQYQLPLTTQILAEIGASYLSNDLIINGETVKSSVQLSLLHRW